MEAAAALPRLRADLEPCAPTLEVRRFDRRLADDRRSLVEHLREIERIEREGEIERFSSALAADAILPEDFAR